MKLTNAQHARLETIDPDTKVVAASDDSIILRRPEGGLVRLVPGGRLLKLGSVQSAEVLEKRIDQCFPRS